MKNKSNIKRKKMKNDTINNEEYLNELPEDSKSTVLAFSLQSLKLFAISPGKFKTAMKYNGLEEDNEISFIEAKNI